VNLPAVAPSGTNVSAIGLALGFRQRRVQPRRRAVGGGDERQVRIPSTRRVSTQNNGEARSSRACDSIQVVSNNTTTVSFRDAALILRARLSYGRRHRDHEDQHREFVARLQ